MINHHESDSKKTTNKRDSFPNLNRFISLVKGRYTKQQIISFTILLLLILLAFVIANRINSGQFGNRAAEPIPLTINNQATIDYCDGVNPCDPINKLFSDHGISNLVTTSIIAPTPIPTPTPTPTTAPTPTPTPTPVPPSLAVTITTPLNLATIKPRGTIAITANVSDSLGISNVSKVEFYVNGLLTCTDSTAIYQCSWKVPGAKNKTYSLQAKAYNRTGLTASSQTITVIAR